MELCKIWWILTSAIYLFHFAELKVTNYLMKKALRRSGASHGVVYLGYGNNPFGPSLRYTPEDNTPSSNMSFANSINSNSIEISDTGQEHLENYSQEKQQGRAKRGVVHLYNMVKCATGCNPLIYKGYGCFCGFLGSGRPVDGIDRCCKKHDWCYNNAGCPPFFEYLQPYYWKCWNGRPICATEHGEYGGRHSCARQLCECDKVLSECLSRYPCPHTRAMCYSSPWRLLQNAFMLL